jgi:hypothetical protein
MENELAKLKSELRRYKTWVPPGHPYSPIPSKKDILKKESAIFKLSEGFYGIDLKVEQQRTLYQDLLISFESAPFSDDPKEGFRYFYNNPLFGLGDGLVLYGMLRKLAPHKIIEIGTGFSTALMLDVNEKYFDGDMDIFCIEAFPNSISEQLKTESGLNIVEDNLYDIDLTFFQSLQPNDILFIDSSHVAKTGSDVVYLFQTVLPLLEAGVHIHIHDIFSNFDYPLNWVAEGRAWNEAYILRTFLMYNDVYEVVAFNSYMGHYHNNWFKHNAPQFLSNPGGSFWMKKVK